MKSLKNNQQATELDKMVFYFTSTTVDPPAFIYVGKDKVESKSSLEKPNNIPDCYEDEDLIKYGWDEDVW